MALVYATTNAQEVAAFLVERAGKLSLFAGVATAIQAEARKEAVLRALHDEAPVGDGRDGGHLADRFSATLVTSPEGARLGFTSSSPHADFVLHGTGIYHVPDPHGAWDVGGLQVFPVEGTTVFARHTHHEGQQPDDYAGRALAN